MVLKDYNSKRKFDETPEPKPLARKAKGGLAFVVHKHAARALHYDLRLELQGVLKSWAVPKGPSLDPSQKRLAVMVEDHPFDYKDFEGIIPEHNYGAGSVIIWDRGYYRHPSDSDGKHSERLLLEGLEKGDLKFFLEGEKLHGEFALVKIRKDEKSWLLLKKKDSHATTDDVLGDNRSVVSGRTLQEVTEENPQKSSRTSRMTRIRREEALEEGHLKDAPVKPMPHNVRPMLASLIDKPFDNPDWIYEMKWDGYRAIAEIEEGKVRLYSRNGKSLAKKFSPVAEALKKFGFDAVLDGEVTATNDDGVPDFQMLQDYGKSGRGHLLYYVFDLIYLEGRDVTELPLIKRKEILKNILPDSPKIRFSDHVEKDGTLFFKVVEEKGLEGVVAKRSQSKYRMGTRSRQWLKVKTHHTQEAVIGGFTQPRGSRKGFGSLVLGVFEGKNLIFIGHSGGGFSAAAITSIHKKLEPLIRKTCPFKVEPETNMPVTWIRPVLVCEVIFHGWTDEGLMRQPVFSRLREDKSAKDVVKEKVRVEF